ncbi:Krueppel homolog 2 [Episyrphus balteatus]|uniref:Krueppel homolog 2 n=1 Tax=Episyrphus balteatus TaxID=286459 RepID=UPI00248502DF|nr:Krueppel homolog 2 [Episyrphus balteatus]XP_055852448.1 Krueppel homolog 2 [Episyrphus balteatus]
MADDAGDPPRPENERPSSPPPQENVSGKIVEHIKENKIDVAMWATRILAIFFTAGYVLPIFGTAQSSFNKVLLANAATNALRLHQRLPRFALSKEFLARLFTEDSCHYLMFSLIFFNVQPTLFILVPIVLFAVLHAASYSLKIVDLIGQNSWWGARFLISLVEFQATNILKAVAFSEIFIMPLAIILTFMGKAGLMTPFVYYHFLQMRYNSRRNPYTRNAFAELRMAVESLASLSPPIVGKVLRGGIAFVNRLSPQPQPTPPPTQ